MIYRIEVTPRYPEFPDSEGEALLADVREHGATGVSRVRVVKIYKLEGIDSLQKIKKIANQLLVERLWQDHAINTPVIAPNGARTVEVTLKPGMMNTEIASIMKAVADMGIAGLTMAGTGKKYIFYGQISEEELAQITDKLLMNKLIEEKNVTREKTLLIGGIAASTNRVFIRQTTDNELMSLSQDKLWLTLPEMKAIKNYYVKLGRDPTDLELETIAQTWSEHCYHKTFKANLIINGVRKKPLIERIMQATEEINSPYTLSVFTDNAGVIVFNEDFGIAGKVETHNSPSAIEPYGGAATGSGGVFRDVISTGKGAKVIVSTDMFCFAPPNMPEEKIPKGCLHPRRLLKRIVAGVRDYGNRMGIPTNNGSVYFHPDFRAKPTVIVGAYGLIPRKYIKKDKLRKGDLIYTVGGKTGRDGIHGATFSSGEMTERTQSVSASAVQIGNAIEEKRMFDAILVCRDHGYIKSIQDCGAGGFSSAVGEIAKDNGCVVYLERAPLKYSGLAPWEIWVSESQEREVIIIDPKNKKNIDEIFKHYNVEATMIGEITDSKRLLVFYQDELVGDMDMEFLHHGVPTTTRLGSYKKPKFPEPEISEPKDYEETLTKILSSWNVTSKEPIVRLYDHEVQGTSVLKPFSGVYHDGPNNAAVIEPILGLGKGLAVAHGMHPVYNRIDSYWGAVSAIDEAVRNLISVGADPARIALLDNFIWPKPEEEEIGQLDQAVSAIVDVAKAWRMPFVSGKDSLSSTYKSKGGEVIKIPPVLCISAFAPIADITKVITSDLKKAGNIIYLLGETKKELGGSEYYQLFNELGNSVPQVNINQAMRIFTALHKAIRQKLVVSSHDVSDGGVAVTISEMCFGGNLGMQINIGKTESRNALRPDLFLFSESNTRFVVEIEPQQEQKLTSLFKGLPILRLGMVSSFPILEICNQGRLLIRSEIRNLKEAWQKPMKGVFS